MKPLLAVLSFCVMSVPLWADTRQPLSEISELQDGLFVAAMVRGVDRRCDTMEARKLQGFLFLSRLNSTAKSYGYSQDEIDAYLDDEAEKDRMRARAAAYLTENGYDPTDNSELCRFGRDQVAAGTQIGKYLRLR